VLRAGILSSLRLSRRRSRSQHSFSPRRLYFPCKAQIDYFRSFLRLRDKIFVEIISCRTVSGKVVGTEHPLHHSGGVEIRR
jgi:hypothetical protein